MMLISVCEPDDYVLKSSLTRPPSVWFYPTYPGLLPVFLLPPSLSPRILSRTSPLALPRFLKALSFASLDKEELLSPISQSTLHRCSSVRSMVSSATLGCNDDYIGLALPMNINDMFHIRDSTYFQQRISPPSEERKRFLFGDGDGKGGFMWDEVLKLLEVNRFSDECCFCL